MPTGWMAEHAHSVLKEKLAELRAGGAGANEATTRLRVIDTILFDVLKWDRLAVEAEKYARTEGYADYMFGPGIFSMVLEAKRDGKDFVLPEREYPPSPVPFSLLAQECPAAADAMRQAQGYAVQFGARYSAITNGRQWILALTYVPLQRVEDRSVFVFESLDAISTKFRLFHECFSDTAIATNLPNQRLLDARQSPAPPKLATKIAYPVPADKNKLVNTLRRVLQLVWDEANFDPDSETFLSHCYITPDPAEDMLRVAKELLEQRSRTDAAHAGIVEAANINVVAQRKVAAEQEVVERERAVVLLGRIGTGKSTFIKYLKHVSAKDVLKDKYIQIDVDFLSQPATAAEVPSFILDQIERELKDREGIAITSDSFVRHALRKEVKEFHASPRGRLLSVPGREAELADAEVTFMETFTSERFKFFRHAIRHIRGSHGKSVAIFFDNLDRRDDDLQEQAFLRSSAIAAEWAALVFVCLRPSTVQRSQSRGVLDTIAPRMITISPPKTVPMLRKRFQYAAKFASKALPAEAYFRASFSSDTEASLPQAAELFEACDLAMFKKPHLAVQYEAVANGNVRMILKYVRETLTSNHLDTRKITDRLAAEFELDEHEALRALLLGPYIHYEPNSSLFANLFDIRHADPTEHFSRIFLLDYCQRHANTVDKYGFISAEGVHRYMSSLGYSATHVAELLVELFKKKYIEGRSNDEEPASLGENLRLGSLGNYHIASLIRKFDYLDAMVVDTPILDPATRAKMSDARVLAQRTYRAREFLRYLDQASESVTDAQAKRVWSDISVALANDITDIEQAAGIGGGTVKKNKNGHG